MAGAKRRWLTEVTVYTLAGSVTSAFVGATLGWLGGLVFPQPVGRGGIVLALAVAVMAMARELGWIKFPLPQLRRQTRDIWAKIFPRPVAAGLWGLDLGLFFTTYFTFAGLWLLVVLAVLVGAPAFGAALFVVYWLGRALSVWIASWLLPSAGATAQFLDSIDGQYRLFQRLHVLGLVWSAIVFIFWLIHGIPM